MNNMPGNPENSNINLGANSNEALTQEEIARAKKFANATNLLMHAEAESEAANAKEQGDITDPKALHETMDAAYEAMQKSDLTEETQENVGGLTREQAAAISAQYAASSAPEPGVPTPEADKIGLQEAPVAVEKRSLKETLNTPVSDLAKETIQNIKKHKKAAVAMGVVLGMVASVAFGVMASAGEGGGEKPNAYAGELPNGTRYDYTDYADRFVINDDGWEEEAIGRWGENNYKVVLNENGEPWGVTSKESWNAYGKDLSGNYENREGAAADMWEKAIDSPEALASYVYYMFTDEEKEAVGINDIVPANEKDGITMVDIDNYISKNKGGGELQNKCLKRLKEVLESDLTDFVFYEENDTEMTNYIYYYDDNEDGHYTPDELHLGYDTCQRKGAKQFDIYRKKLVGHNKDGDYYESRKVIDINMECGDQPNTDIAPPGVKKIPRNPESAGNESAGDESAGNESAGNESAGNESAGNESAGDESAGNESAGNESAGNESAGNESAGNESAGNESAGNESAGNESAGNESAGDESGWGKEGDIDTGDLVDVDPAGPKTDDYNYNDGNKGYVDDGGATPGAGSEYNGVVNPDRKPGGEQQGGGTMNGENPNSQNIEVGIDIDNGGNAKQEEAQQGGNTPGGNNNSDEVEEQRVADGDF